MHAAQQETSSVEGNVEWYEYVPDDLAEYGMNMYRMNIYLMV